MLSAILAALTFPVFAQTNLQVQFDAFFGHDGVIKSSAWFPLLFEVKNDGESFTGTIEVRGGAWRAEQVRTLPIELPKGTLKRVVVSGFAPGGGWSQWDARLLDEDGDVVAEHPGLQPRLHLDPDAPLLGAISRSLSFTPTIQATAMKENRLQPTAVRLLAPLLPDSALDLEALTAIYLNSSKAAELSEAQAKALLGWLRQGGHLIVSIEELHDVEAASWLKSLLQAQFQGTTFLHAGSTLEGWLKEPWQSPRLSGSVRLGKPREGVPLVHAPASSPFDQLAADSKFESAPLQIASVKLPGEVVLAAAGVPGQNSPLPLIVKRPVGFGTVSVLLFSPEREPMRTWANQPAFWAKLTRVPPEWYTSPDFNAFGGWPMDSIFGALLETRQVRALPLGGLLLLLVGYLAVIGPLDYFWLKRIRRPMLTWVTFPLYVLLFSASVYLIGFKLRAGEFEWNELHIVDVDASSSRNPYVVRGRTYGSLYSPTSRTYDFTGPESVARFRAEASGGWRPQGTWGGLRVLQKGESFFAKASVPVWSSQLFACDWNSSTSVPFKIEAIGTGAEREVRIENRSESDLRVRCVSDDKVFELGIAERKRTRSFKLNLEQGKDLAQHQRGIMTLIQGAVSARNQPFARRRAQFLDDPLAVVEALSFPRAEQEHFHFLELPGFSLDEAESAGSLVLLIAADNHAPFKPLPVVPAKRSRIQTTWRVLVPSNSHE